MCSNLEQVMALGSVSHWKECFVTWQLVHEFRFFKYHILALEIQKKLYRLSTSLIFELNYLNSVFMNKFQFHFLIKILPNWNFDGNCPSPGEHNRWPKFKNSIGGQVKDQVGRSTGWVRSGIFPPQKFNFLWQFFVWFSCPAKNSKLRHKLKDTRGGNS